MKQIKLLFLVTCYISLVMSTAQAAIYQKQAEHALPTCDNVYLMNNVIAAIEDHNRQNPPENLYEKKKQLLLLRDFKEFSEVPAENFASDKNFNISRKLISLKINNQLANEDIRVCKSTGEGPSKNLFLLIYSENYEIIIDLINFTPKQDEFLIKYTTR